MVLCVVVWCLNVLLLLLRKFVSLANLSAIVLLHHLSLSLSILFIIAFVESNAFVASCAMKKKNKPATNKANKAADI